MYHFTYNHLGGKLITRYVLTTLIVQHPLLDCDCCIHAKTHTTVCTIWHMAMRLMIISRYSGAFCEDNLALNRPAWSLYMSPQDPPSKAVDGDLSSAGYTGWMNQPFLAVDLGTSVPVGRVSINCHDCKCNISLTYSNITEFHWCHTWIKEWIKTEQTKLRHMFAGKLKHLYTCHFHFNLNNRPFWSTLKWNLCFILLCMGCLLRLNIHFYYPL